MKGIHLSHGRVKCMTSVVVLVLVTGSNSIAFSLSKMQQPEPAPPAPAPAMQTIAFTSTPPANAVVGGATYTVSANASSGLPVAFSADPSSAGICTVSGAIVKLVGSGTCTIDANQAGNAAFRAAAQVRQSFAIGSPTHSLSVQTINFGSTPPSGIVVGGSPYVVVATASSGLPATLAR
jgi:hypothetical protein